MSKANYWHRLVGPLSSAESVLVVGCASAAVVATWCRTRAAGEGRAAVMAAVAGDLVGGLVTFQLLPTRRAYAATSVAERARFVVIHLHPFAVPLTSQGTWRLAVFRYGATLLATSALETCLPHSGARRAAANLTAGVLSVADLRLARAEQQRWFGPVFFFKVVGGHSGISRIRTLA